MLKLLRPLSALFLGVSASAFAASPNEFQGSFKTEYGEVRLKTNGNFVCGDYANRGHIEGYIHTASDGMPILRARFERTDGYVGFVEWYLKEYEGEGNYYGLRGNFVQMGQAMPKALAEGGNKWNGERKSPDVPTLVSYKGSCSASDFRSKYQSNISKGTNVTNWIFAGDVVPEAISPWVGTWDTSYGPVRLNQAGTGGPVYGDYGNLGSIRGIAKVVNGKHVLRARFDRDDGQKGYIEWVSDGTSDDSLDGRWNWASNSPPIWNNPSSGTAWNAKRIEKTRPTITKFSGNIHDRSVMTRGDSEFANWIYYVEPKKTAPKVDINRAGNLENITHAENILHKKIPFLKKADPDLKPRYIEIYLTTLTGFDNFVESVTFTDFVQEYYGLIGIYMSCVTDSGSRQISPVGGASNRVWDKSRNNAVKAGVKGYTFPNTVKLRFPIDQQCLNSDDGRFAIQFQTNIKEKDLSSGTDDVYGYRAGIGYLDDYDQQIDDSMKTYFSIYSFDGGNGERLYISYRESMNSAVAGVNEQNFQIFANIRFIE